MRKLILAIGFVSIATVACAQQQPLPEYTFKLNQNDLNVISKGLQTQPFGEVAPLMQKLQTQFIAQQPKPEEKKEEKKEDKEAPKTNEPTPPN